MARSLLLSELSELSEASLLSELFVLSEELLPESAKSLLLSELSVVAVEVSVAEAEPLSASAADTKLAPEVSMRAILTARIFLLKDFIFDTPLKII
jgi:hypothetical protein